MARHKTTYLPPPPPHFPPPAPAPTRRLAELLLRAAGELILVGFCILGIVVTASWVISGYSLDRRYAQRPPPPIERVDRIDRPVWQWRCWRDERHYPGARLCEQVPTWAAPRRYPARWDDI
jgi:hypothetical protein